MQCHTNSQNFYGIGNPNKNFKTNVETNHPSKVILGLIKNQANTTYLMANAGLSQVTSKNPSNA